MRGKSHIKAKISFKLSSRLSNRFQPFCLMLYRIAILLAIVASDFFNVFCVCQFRGLFLCFCDYFLANAVFMVL
nr:hypothetical protein [uncultured Campylobacter sp.]